MCEHNSISVSYIYNKEKDNYTKIRKCIICNTEFEKIEITKEDYNKEIGIAWNTTMN